MSHFTRTDTSRIIKAPTGTTLTCKSWLTEAPYRMIPLAILGEGDVMVGDKIMPAKQALANAGLHPITLAACCVL